MPQSDKQRVLKRQVFYIPGYDPNPPRRYRELYRTESDRQAAISGYELDMLGPVTGDGFGWRVRFREDGVQSESEINVLVWSDLVQNSMKRSIAASYLELVRTAWTYVSSGALRRLMWLRKGPVIAALYPVGVLLVQALLAALAGWLAGAAVSALAGLVAGPGLSRALGWMVALPVIVACLRFWRRIDGRIFAHYLMHDYAFSASHKGANPPELDARLDQFSRRIAQALASDVDEVLVVGHSSGAHLAVNIVAGLIRQGAAGAHSPRLALLTLGQVIPMMSFLPRADRLRADLNFLSQSDVLAWVDVSAPGDGCSFALCDPVEVSGVAPPAKRWPLVLSAAFSQTLSPERWRALKRRYFRLHFQYLCAFDRPGDYDYFAITAGPITLAARFAGRKPSQSRIDVPASPYTSMAA